MSLAHLSFPSILHVLEAEGLIPKEESTPGTKAAQIDISIESAAIHSDPSTLQSNLMKTVDYRTHDLGADGEEPISVVDRVAKDAAHVDAEAATVFNEQREEHDATLQLEKHDHALIIWVKNNLPPLVNAVRKLFPIKVAETVLRKVGRKLAEL